MATTARRRGTALLALAMASGVTLAVSVPAGAATNAPPAYYQGVTSANVLGVALHLPAALPALPNIPKDLAVNLIGVNGNAVHNTLAGTDANASTAVSNLASGSLIDALPTSLGLKKTLTATLSADPTEGAKSSAAQSINASPLINVTVGGQLAKALKLSNTSSSTLTDGKILDLGSLLQIPAAGTTLLSTVQGAINQADVTGQVNAAVQQVESALNGVLANDPTGQTAAIANQVEATVNSLQDQINAFLSNLQNKIAGTSVVTVKLLDATQSIAPSAGAAVSNASVHLADLDILDGVLTVKGFESGATAIANGKPGGASASFVGHKPIVAVGVSNILTGTLDETGLTLQGVPALGDTVNSALKTLQSTLNGLLNTLGVHLTFVPGHVDKVDPNGKYAEATGPEYDIVVSNPVDKTALVEVGLGHGTKASVAAAQATKHVAMNNPQAGPGKLPHTGANLPLIAGGGLAFLFGAGYLRRRVMG
jgi:LPXTG-motif cell wall-anchored protein